MLAGHDTEVFLGFIVVQTYQTLMWGLGRKQKREGLRLALSMQLEANLPSASYCGMSVDLMIWRPDFSISSGVAVGGLTWPMSAASSL